MSTPISSFTSVTTRAGRNGAMAWRKRRAVRGGCGAGGCRRGNAAVVRYLPPLAMVGVLMRIFSFSLVSWLGPESPFLFVWAFNTADAVLLSWCAVIKKDMAYTVLNVFWVGVGVVGMVRA